MSCPCIPWARISLQAWFPTESTFIGQEISYNMIFGFSQKTQKSWSISILTQPHLSDAKPQGRFRNAHHSQHPGMHRLLAGFTTLFPVWLLQALAFVNPLKIYCQNINVYHKESIALYLYCSPASSLGYIVQDPKECLKLQIVRNPTYAMCFPI